MDSDGFYEAEINGVRGLIPGIYVEELDENSATVIDVYFVFFLLIKFFFRIIYP